MVPILVCGGALAACASPPAPVTPPPVAGAPVMVKPPPPRPEIPKRPPPAVATPLAPEGLKGLSRDETTALLGQPADRSELATGTVWTYRRNGCALSLLFYPEVESGVERVLGYETESGGDAALCLKRLREAGGRNGR